MENLQNASLADTIATTICMVNMFHQSIDQANQDEKNVMHMTLDVAEIMCVILTELITIMVSANMVDTEQVKSKIIDIGDTIKQTMVH